MINVMISLREHLSVQTLTHIITDGSNSHLAEQLLCVNVFTTINVFPFSNQWCWWGVGEWLSKCPLRCHFLWHPSIDLTDPSAWLCLGEVKQVICISTSCKISQLSDSLTIAEKVDVFSPMNRKTEKDDLIRQQSNKIIIAIRLLVQVLTVH